MIKLIQRGPRAIIFQVDQSPLLRITFYATEEDLQEALDFYERFPNLPGCLAGQILLSIEKDRIKVLSKYTKESLPQIRNKLSTSLGIKVDKNLVFKNSTDALWYAMKYGL